MTVVSAPPRRPPGSVPTADSELTWLLHRAAQRLRAAVGEHAEADGVSLRDHIVLSALYKTPGLTQIELGRAVGLDKTTLTAQLDRLEKAGLVSRVIDPADRRARLPRLTPLGEATRSRIAAKTDATEASVTEQFSAAEIGLVKRVLVELIGDTYDPGSCL